VLLPQEIWLVDFKTDEIRAGELPAKTKSHAPQLKLYAHALSRIYSRPVTNCWLHFLSQKRSIPVEGSIGAATICRESSHPLG
jgi:ATP-dependent exoDNAse (exonuclease V) beta subunit